MSAMSPIQAADVLRALTSAEASKADFSAMCGMERVLDEQRFGDAELAYLADQNALKAQIERATGVSAERLLGVLS